MADVPDVTPDMEKCGPLLWTRLQCAVEVAGGQMMGRIFFHSSDPCIQQGPTCGFVALVLAARAVGLEADEKQQVDLEELIAWARMIQFTKNGEMFSAKWLARIGREFYRGGDFVTIPFPSAEELIETVNNGSVFLVPYDCEKNFEPMNRNGEGAHWAAIVGYFVLEAAKDDGATILFAKLQDRIVVADDELHVIAYQGKSKYPAVWKYSVLKESNGQLRVADTRRATSFQLPERNQPEQAELHELSGLAVKVSPASAATAE